MNRVLIQNEPVDGKKFSINKAEYPEKYDHLLNHIKVVVGSPIKVAVLNQGLADAIVKKIEADSITFEIGPLKPSAHPPYTLLVATSRPPTMKKILEHGTTLGVKKFIFFTADLSEKSYLTSKIYEEKNLEKLLVAGVEQSGQYCQLPVVVREENLSKALKKHVSHTSCFKALLSLTTEDSWQTEKLNATSEIVLAIGPERGWTRAEEKLLEENQFIPTKISQTILRVEMAVFTALGQLEYVFKNRT